MSETTEAPTGIVASQASEVGSTFMRPLGDRVIVIEEQSPEKTTSGIFLPESTRETTRRGVVVACGPGLRSPLTGLPTGIGLEEGQRVIFEPMSGTEITVDGQALLVIHESSIISVFSESGDEIA